MPPAPPAMTVEEYFRTPVSSLPQELAYGVWRVADAPTPRHQSIVFAFGVAMDKFARLLGRGRMLLAPVDVVLDPGRHLVVQPDLIVVAAGRLDIIRERVWGAPDLALEVLSPRPRIGSLDERLGWFAEYGVRECWLVHQNERVVEVVEFHDRAISTRCSFLSQAPIRSRVLPEWDLSLATVMQGHVPLGRIEALAQR